MADTIVSNRLLTDIHSLHNSLEKIIHYALIACICWAILQLINVITHVPKALKPFIDNQISQRPEVVISPLSGTLFGILTFVALSMVVLTLMSAIHWYQQWHALRISLL